MEDKYICQQLELPNGELAMLFAIFDGHNGEDVSEYAKHNYIEILTKQIESHGSDYRAALKNSFLKVD